MICCLVKELGKALWIGSQGTNAHIDFFLTLPLVVIHLIRHRDYAMLISQNIIGRVNHVHVIEALSNFDEYLHVNYWFNSIDYPQTI
jgi:hypothetical protein